MAAATEDDDFAALVDAVLGGRRQAIGPELRRMRESGMNPVGLLLAFERRAAQLAALASRLMPGMDLGNFLRGEAAARRIFLEGPAGDRRAVANLARESTRTAGPASYCTAPKKLLSSSQDSELLLAEGLVHIGRTACAVTKHPTKETA
ncbi:hypothetical protein ACFSTD_20480 [Novosphingobium colocasiae]